MKLVLANTDGRVLLWGEPPWANADQLTDYSIVEIGNNVATPEGLRDYRYVNGAFVYDPLPPTQAELDRAVMVFAQVETMLTQIANRRTQIAADIAALAAASTFAATKPIVDRMLNAEDAELGAQAKMLRFLRWQAGE